MAIVCHRLAGVTRGGTLSRPYAASMSNRDSPVSRTDRADPSSGLEPEPAASEDVQLVQEGTGDPDGFKRLWTPHRMAYIRGENKPGGEDGLEQCPFCRIPGLSDADGLVVARGRAVFTVLNLYPYNSGHLMVCPYRHAADYTDLDEAETAELADHTKRAVQALRNVAGAQGFNVGMNLGAVAGAGIAAHLHQHVVPRWGGDTNFMPIVGQTRVLPQLLRDTRKLIAEAWPAS
jgi:ATP adenylyltransferase